MQTAKATTNAFVLLQLANQMQVPPPDSHTTEMLVASCATSASRRWLFTAVSDVQLEQQCSQMAMGALNTSAVAGRSRWLRAHLQR